MERTGPIFATLPFGSAGLWQQAESLEIAETVGERLLDQSGCQRCRRSPATEADQGESCGSARAVSRTSKVRADWTRRSQRSKAVRPRCQMAPRPSIILRSRNRGSLLHPLAQASTMAGADRVGSVDSSRRALAQLPEISPVAPDHPDDDALEEARATRGVAQPGRPAGIAGDGVAETGSAATASASRRAP